MKTWKLVSGIISIVLSAVVVYQSRAASIIDRIANNLLNAGSYSGTIGYIVALLMVAGGIVSIVTRKGNKVGDIAIIVLFGVAALLGYTMGGIYVDLIVWSTWCVACAVVAIISLLRKPEAVQKRTAPAPRSSEQGSSLVQCPFNYTSKDMVRAEAMSSYVTRFEFNFGLAEGDCSKLFSFVERAVSPDVEVVSAFIAKKNGTPCACAMAISKLIIADDWKTRTIQTLDISGFTYENGTLTVKSKADDIILSVSAQRGQAICDVCNQSLIACKKEIESNSKVNV